MKDFTIGEAFKNSISTWSAVSVFVTALMFVVGIAIGIIAIYQFKKLGDNTNETVKTSVYKAIFLTFLSAMMIAVARFIPILSETLLTDANTYTPEKLLSEVNSTGMLPGIAEALTSILLFVQALGTIAIFRGFLMLKSHAEGKLGELPKAITHIVGGVLAVNIQLTIAMFASTFYPNFDMSWLV